MVAQKRGSQEGNFIIVYQGLIECVKNFKMFLPIRGLLEAFN